MRLQRTVFNRGHAGGKNDMSGQAKRKRITAAQRMEVWQKYNGHCAYCGCEITLEKMQVDHMESIYRHEKDYIAGNTEYMDKIENYMPACRMCNFYKMTYTLEQFRQRLQTMTERLEKQFIYRLAKKYGIVREQEKGITFYFETVVKGKENGT